MKNNTDQFIIILSHYCYIKLYKKNEHDTVRLKIVNTCNAKV